MQKEPTTDVTENPTRVFFNKLADEDKVKDIHSAIAACVDFGRSLYTKGDRSTIEISIFGRIDLDFLQDWVNNLIIHRGFKIVGPWRFIEAINAGWNAALEEDIALSYGKIPTEFNTYFKANEKYWINVEVVDELASQRFIAAMCLHPDTVHGVRVNSINRADSLIDAGVFNKIAAIIDEERMGR